MVYLEKIDITNRLKLDMSSINLYGEHFVTSGLFLFIWNFHFIENGYSRKKDKLISHVSQLNFFESKLKHKQKTEMMLVLAET